MKAHQSLFGRKALWLLKIGVSALFVAWLISMVDISALGTHIGNLRWHYLAVSLASISTLHFWNILRWRLCIRFFFTPPSLRHLMVSYFSGLFVGQLLPSEYGGDLIRAKDTWRFTTVKSQAVVSVILSRLTGLAGAYLLLLVAGLMQLKPLATSGLQVYWMLIVIGLPVVVAVMATIVIVTRRFPVPARWRGLAESLQSRFDSIVVPLRACVADRAGLSLLLLHSLGPQVVMAVNLQLFMLAANLELQFHSLLLISPCIAFISIVPLGLGGLGWKESALVVLLGFCDVSPESALLIGLLSRAMQYVFAAAGALVSPFRSQLLYSPMTND